MLRFTRLTLAVISGVTLGISWPVFAQGTGEPLLDPAIQGEERDVIARVIATLRPEDRRNVIYVVGNRI
jgi:ABC-type Fe3+-siderophore transport system permease subunit